MDAFTHTLAAAALWRSRLLPPEAGVWGALALFAAANAADAEGLIQIGSTAAYIRNYHGAAHSLLGTLIIAGIIAAAAAWGLRRAEKRAALTSLFALTLAGAGSHLLLDSFQGYGAALFWPVSSTRYVLPLMADYNVSNIAILLLALGLPLLLNAVNAEMGAGRVNASRFAVVGLLLLAALLPVRYYLRSRADYAASTVLVEDEDSYAVCPSPFLLWRWYMVQDTPLAYLVQEVDGSGLRVLAGVARFRKPTPNNVLVAARDTAAAQAFLDMALYPLFALDQGHRGMLVRVRDMKFYVPGGSDRPYSLEVEVNSQLRILSQHANF